MGGTFIRLCEQGHEVHVAYQTTGNIAVFDADASRFADFVREFARLFGTAPEQVERIEDQIEEFLRHKKPGEVDSPELQKIKGLIRRTEARPPAATAACRTTQFHFLDMPFYETGRCARSRWARRTSRSSSTCSRSVKPHQVYAAGDLSDPHGTHRVCLAAILPAVERLQGARTGSSTCEVWLYRGAWQEWGRRRSRWPSRSAPTS